MSTIRVLRSAILCIASWRAILSCSSWCHRSLSHWKYKHCCINHGDQRVFWKIRSNQFEIIINVLVSSFRFIWIPRLWVYGHYKYFNSFIVGIDFIRQNLTSMDVRKSVPALKGLNLSLGRWTPISHNITFIHYASELFRCQASLSQTCLNSWKWRIALETKNNESAKTENLSTKLKVYQHNN